MAWLRDELNVDHALNYKTDDLVAKFKEIAPDGITHYFDNTAGPITEAFMFCSAIGAKVCVCGAIAGEWLSYTVLYCHVLSPLCG